MQVRQLLYKAVIKLQTRPLPSRNNFPRVLGAAVDAPTRKIGDLFTGIVISQIKEGHTPYCLLAFHLSGNKSSVKCNKKEEMQD